MREGASRVKASPCGDARPLAFSVPSSAAGAHKVAGSWSCSPRLPRRHVSRDAGVWRAGSVGQYYPRSVRRPLPSSRRFGWARPLLSPISWLALSFRLPRRHISRAHPQCAALSTRNTASRRTFERRFAHLIAVGTHASAAVEPSRAWRYGPEYGARRVRSEAPCAVGQHGDYAGFCCSADRRWSVNVRDDGGSDRNGSIPLSVAIQSVTRAPCRRSWTCDTAIVADVVALQPGAGASPMLQFFP